ncbi:SH3 domain-containing protein [Sphingomonas sp. ST-64]|uniref:SH3 domain-containing protein n=1 Tax=Sphingomonas plantiphila TaxID=3163295 RepID=A0ABW8YPB7_9SPHN
MTQAARRDLADIRLADRVFAPHYAAPALHTVSVPTSLRADRSDDAELLATLATGDIFEVLEVSGGLAWGRAPGVGKVGYVAASDLGIAA